MRVVVSVPEMYAAAVDPGDPVLIRLQALGGKEIEGKVARTSWTLDPRTRTLRAEIDVPNPRGRSGRASTSMRPSSSRSIADALTVPDSPPLVRQDARAYCVAVVDGRAVRKPVTLGLDDGTPGRRSSPASRATRRSSRRGPPRSWTGSP